MRRGDFVDALAQFQRLSTRYPDDARFWIRQGDCLNMLNMYTQALDCFGRVTDADEGVMSECQFGRGVGLYRLGRYGEALDSFQAALNFDPASEEAMVNLGATYLELERFEEAIATCRQILSQWPESWDGHFLSGNISYALEKYEDALAAYLRAVSLCDGRAGLWHNMANAYCELERHDEAASAYRHAVQIDPNRADTWLHLGGVYHRKLERLPEALEAFEAGKRAAPNDEDIRHQIGFVHLCLEEYEAALAEFRDAEQLNPKSWRAHLGTGLSLAGMGSRGPAVEALSRAAALAPAEPRPHFELGLMYCAMKRNDAAVKEHDTLTQLNSGDSAEMASNLAEQIAEAFPGDAADSWEDG